MTKGYNVCENTIILVLIYLSFKELKLKVCFLEYYSNCTGGIQMTLSSFLKLVEIQTKLASVIPFVLGTLFALYRYNSFKFENFIIMFISLLTFDMATTAINNYFDYKKEKELIRENCKSENIIINARIPEKTASFVIFALLTIAVIFGVLLTLKTDIILLIIGVICFIVGILYTFGPIPISRMPLGEVFSGFFMGFIILFLSIYIHIYDSALVTLMYTNNILSLSLNVVEILFIFLVSIPLVTGIANIMLANNICDVEEDIKIKRFTLPYYIGRENALKLFKILYYVGYADIVILVLLKIAPVASLLVLTTLIPVNKNIKLFINNPSKKETFVVSVKNFFIINFSHIIVMTITLLFKLY